MGLCTEQFQLRSSIFFNEKDLTLIARVYGHVTAGSSFVRSPVCEVLGPAFRYSPGDIICASGWHKKHFRCGLVLHSCHRVPGICISTMGPSNARLISNLDLARTRDLCDCCLRYSKTLCNKQACYRWEWTASWGVRFHASNKYVACYEERGMSLTTTQILGICKRPIRTFTFWTHSVGGTYSLALSLNREPMRAV